MATLLSCQEITKSFHGRPLFERLSLSVSDRDRLAILGPNGAGKSTLFRIICGFEEADEGSVVARQGLRVAYVAQVPSFPLDETILSVAQNRLGEIKALPGDESENYHLQRVLTQLGFGGGEAPLDAAVSQLSGGWVKRLSLAIGLAQNPDLLILDEPTNHLDLAGIFWLEKLLKDAPFAWMMVSHDRTFVERTAHRIIEVNRQYPRGIFEAEGAYSDFVEKKAEFLKTQVSALASLDNKVRREIEWLRRGPKARTTKAKGRIDEAHALIEDQSDLRERVQTATKKSVKVDFSSSNRKTKQLLVANDVMIMQGERVLIDKITLTLSPGLRIGLMGANGTGKTTFLKVLAGELQPSAGSVSRADGLKIVYFDQTRKQLDHSVPLRNILCPSGDAVIFRGQSLHIASWAKRFHFVPSQLDVPIGELSGGEQARALIARLMLEPADVLFLDEPTNDLDIPTLESLEDALSDFSGALVLVSHDRYLIDSICNVIAALDGQGQLELFADLAQWEKTIRENQERLGKQTTPPVIDTEIEIKSRNTKQKRLSYLEQREFERIESDIQAAEQELAEKESVIQDTAITVDATRLSAAYTALEEARMKVEKLYERWAELEAKIR